MPGTGGHWGVCPIRIEYQQVYQGLYGEGVDLAVGRVSDSIGIDRLYRMEGGLFISQFSGVWILLF